MEIRIGIVNSRELSFETSESAESVAKTVATALDSGATHVTFTDSRGGSFIVPTAGIGYVELGGDQTRRVGFVA